MLKVSLEFTWRRNLFLSVRLTRVNVNTHLTKAVRLNRQMPHPSSADNRQYMVEHVRSEGEGQGIIMRFRIQRWWSAKLARYFNFVSRCFKVWAADWAMHQFSTYLSYLSHFQLLNIQFSTIQPSCSVFCWNRLIVVATPCLYGLFSQWTSNDLYCR